MQGALVAAVVAALVGVAGSARDARAGATVDLFFIGVNGGSIGSTNTVTADVYGGDTYTMAVLLTTDQALTVASLSLNYELEGHEVLDIVSAFVWKGLSLNPSGTIRFAPFRPLDPSTATFVGSFNGATNDQTPPIAGLPAGAYQMATVTWKVNAVNAQTDVGSHDILAGLFNQGVDVFRDAGFDDISGLVRFRSATVILMPEPGTASLLGLGLVGLIQARRRLRASRRR